MKYAQIDNNRVMGVSELSRGVDSPDMILIDSLDAALLGRAYDYQTGQFGEKAEQGKPGPTEAEKLSAKIDYLTLLMEPEVTA